MTLYDDAIVKSSVSLTNVSIDTDGTEKVTITAYGLPGNNSQWYFVCKDVSFKCIEFKISYTDLDNQNSIWRNRGINCTSGVVEVDSCSFVLGDYAGIAIEPNTGSLVCKDTTFEGNATRGCMGIYLRNGMPATITGCTFGKLTNAIVMETTYKTGWPNDVSIVGNTFNLNGIPSDDGQNADHNGRVTALAMYEGLTPENFTISGNTFNTFDDVPAALFSMVKYSAESIDCLDNVDEVREIIVDNSNTYGADAGYTYNGSGATVFKNMSENVKCNIKEHSHTSE